MLLGAVEGYYGPPLAHGDRIALIEWLTTRGYNAYAYGPKDDPYHRAAWREPYPDDQTSELRELIEAGARCGVDVVLSISPGLDWRPGDEEHLVAKLRSFHALGATALGVAWDDVPPGGAELGAAHGEAIAAAVKAVDASQWLAVPTDYATAHATPYLSAFADSLPPDVHLAWTGPSIVSPVVTGAGARALAEELGRPLLFGENFPVNDGTMSGVLHLGPYPQRSADLVDETTGVFCNFMSFARASRVGLAVAARWWRDPSSDREEAWRACVTEFAGLEPLARASRSWVDAPAPDAELATWADAADPRLDAFLAAGCRDGLDPALAAEVEPWLAQWEREAEAMRAALVALQATGHVHHSLAFYIASAWERAKAGREQLFGIRWAYYPVTSYRDGAVVAEPASLVYGENLTDRLCSRALRR